MQAHLSQTVLHRFRVVIADAKLGQNQRVDRRALVRQRVCQSLTRPCVKFRARVEGGDQNIGINENHTQSQFPSQLPQGVPIHLRGQGGRVQHFVHLRTPSPLFGSGQHPGKLHVPGGQFAHRIDFARFGARKNNPPLLIGHRRPKHGGIVPLLRAVVKLGDLINKWFGGMD